MYDNENSSGPNETGHINFTMTDPKPASEEGQEASRAGQEAFGTEQSASRAGQEAFGAEQSASKTEEPFSSASVSSGSQYRYTGPFYQDSINGDGKNGQGGGEFASSGSRKERRKQAKKKKGFGKTIAKTVCIALVFGVVAGAAFQGTNYIGKKLFGDDVTVSSGGGSSSTVTPEIGMVTPHTGTESTGIASVASIVDECMPSLVAITNISVREVQNYWGFGWYSQPQEQEETSTGTGIIIGQNDTELLIVTNNHVISGATTLTVLFSVDEGKEEASAVEAQIKGTDPTKDVGVIAVKLSDIPEETLAEIKTAKIGDSSQVKVGDQVVAIGNALGYGQSVTTGIVSALNREVSLQNDDGSSISNKLIQTDAAINPGNSGGALLNMEGEVIGINEAKLSSNYVEGMGYAIPISDVESIIGDLQNLKTRSEVDADKMGYLGVTCQDVPQEISEQYDMPVGIYLKTVVPGCAADEAGLKKGDILTKFDGVGVSNYNTLRERLQHYEAGETVEVTVQRPEGGSYEEMTVSVTLNSMEEVEAASRLRRTESISGITL